METTFLRYKKGRYYLVTRVTIAGIRREKWTPLSDIDKNTLEAALEIKKNVRNQIVQVPCFNPDCTNTIPMTKAQLETFFISAHKRYNMTIFPFCSAECRDKMIEKHGVDFEK